MLSMGNGEIREDKLKLMRLPEEKVLNGKEEGKTQIRQKNLKNKPTSVLRLVT